MPEYTIVFERRGAVGKKGETDTLWAASVGDAWNEARQKLPKSAKILDVVRSQDYSYSTTGRHF